MFAYKEESIPWDVIIIGSGLAGIYTALNLEHTKKVLLLTKKTLKKSNSYLAQGGIAAVLTDEDSFELHYNDTMETGHGINDPKFLKILIENGPNEVKQLQDWGVPFNRNHEGDLALAKEGAHSVRRIARCGDYTGRAIMETLINRLEKHSNITVIEYANVVEILNSNNKAIGVGVVENNSLKMHRSKFTVLATGGIGQLFKHTTNDETITGDGFKMARQVGLDLKGMGKIQFHPTAFYEDSVNSQRFLISEALRGEGAQLKDRKGTPFMLKKHPLGSLAPRDIVTNEINKLMKIQQTTNVFLDATHIAENEFISRFPTIYEYCLSKNIKPTEQMIPVVPCCHYIMGGIPVNEDGITRLKNLYACGEVAYTNVHGNNRLASNSLLECLVFGKKVAESINNGGTVHE